MKRRFFVFLSCVTVVLTVLNGGCQSSQRTQKTVPQNAAPNTASMSNTSPGMGVTTAQKPPVTPP